MSSDLLQQEIDRTFYEVANYLDRDSVPNRYSGANVVFGIKRGFLVEPIVGTSKHRSLVAGKGHIPTLYIYNEEIEAFFNGKIDAPCGENSFHFYPIGAKDYYRYGEGTHGCLVMALASYILAFDETKIRTTQVWTISTPILYPDLVTRVHKMNKSPWWEIYGEKLMKYFWFVEDDYCFYANRRYHYDQNY